MGREAVSASSRRVPMSSTSINRSIDRRESNRNRNAAAGGAHACACGGQWRRD